MADTRRLLRLQQLMLETLATALQRKVEDPRVVGVTVTRVKLAKDLTTGVVYWSSLEPGGPRRTAERGLDDALPYLQALVAEALATRQTPRLTLRFDENIERSARLGDILAQLARERGEIPDPASPPSEPGDLDDADDDDADDDDDDDDDDPDEADDTAPDEQADGQGDDTEPPDRA